ncbi:MAG: PAS domain-containing sensor histidine kinase [Rhizobacter sp.]
MANHLPDRLDAGTARSAGYLAEIRRQEGLLSTGALQTAILNSANFSSIATDAKGVIQIFNVGAARMLGYAAHDVTNKITPADISDPQELIVRAAALSAEFGISIAPGFEALVFKASRGIEDIYELTYLCKDGTRLPAVVSVTALRDAHESIIGYLLIGTDNTARKQAEAALVKAAALEKAIFNSVNFSKIATDAKGVIQIFNVGAERMLGYSAVDVVDKVTPADISDPNELIARAQILSTEHSTQISPGFEALVFKASRGIEDIYELTYIRKDGTKFPAVVSVTALRDVEEKIIGYLLIGTDNTVRKRLADEVERHRQHQEGETRRANADLQEFTYVASHDLRSPLRGIADLVEWITDELGAAPPGDVKRNLDRIGQRIVRLEGLISDLLSYAHAGHAATERSLVDLDAMVRGILEIQPLPPAFLVELAIGVQPFQAIAAPLNTALRNLLGNAVKHHDGVDGRLRVQARRDGRYCEISVIDDGPGVPPQARERIFKLFQTLTVNERGNGGIGLALTKRLIEVHGGRIEVISPVAAGRGACFRFWWPMFPESVADDSYPRITS